MRRAVCVAFCILSLSIPLMAQTRQPVPRPETLPQASTYDPARQAGLYRETWYDVMLRQFNPDNLDCGQWLEQRREAFLEQTAANPYFKYGFVTTLLLILLTVALTKALIDKSRMKWLAQERFNDLKRHDQAARSAAREAIRKYNDHMEKCNRVVEAEMARQPVTSETVTAQDSTLTLDEALIGLAESKRELASMTARLDRSNSVAGELTLRLNGVDRGGNGAGSEHEAPQAGPSRSDMIRQINDLQQQLYQERERNKRLKGI